MATQREELGTIQGIHVDRFEVLAVRLDAIERELGEIKALLLSILIEMGGQ